METITKILIVACIWLVLTFGGTVFSAVLIATDPENDKVADPGVVPSASIVDVTDGPGSLPGLGQSLVYRQATTDWTYEATMPSAPTALISLSDITLNNVTTTEGNTATISSNYLNGRQVNGTLQIEMALSRATVEPGVDDDTIPIGTALCVFPENWRPKQQFVINSANIGGSSNSLLMDTDGTVSIAQNWVPVVGMELFGTFTIVPDVAAP